MKVNPKFRLRDPETSKTSIYLDVRWKGQRLVYGTQQTIDPSLWDSVAMRATTNNKLLKGYKQDPKAWEHCNRINTRLDKLSGLVTDCFIKAGDRTLTPDEVKTFILLQIAPQKVKNKHLALNGYIEHFIKEIESGRLQTPKGTKYTTATTKAYKSFRLRFTEFQSKNKRIYDFEDIDIDFYDRFTSYLTSIGNKPNSVGKQVKCLKAIMRAALEQKLHANRTFQSRKFRVQKLESEEIYLTASELNRIKELDLSSNKPLETARDIFLIGCYTGQRVSDYSRITKECISKTTLGHSVIDFKQAKTGNRVVIPIKPDLMKLLKKHAFSVPYMVEQKLNLRIKEVGRLAGINEPVQVTEYRKGLKVLKHVPKYTLIQSHTARRTGATLMHLAGIPLIDIMKISGHRSLKELMQYIRVSEEETAEKLALHPYFAQKKA